jgi:hypothetical protein
LRVVDRSEPRGKPVIGSPPSVTYAAILFKKMSMCMGIYDNVTLTILARIRSTPCGSTPRGTGTSRCTDPKGG